ncbi:hypothetical protein AAG570_008354 [Ranatra chinensis]|uniref:3'(2'),5'-bisphosphate nucleotidase 1 n=1 Tax=Ranatra chinensis TaxID=642074 RepID=A0ABD0XUC3_9HEMI
MAEPVPLLLNLIASSVTAASRAGEIIRDVMRKGDLGIIEKGENDLQTEADRSAQHCIIASLAQKFPNITIIGEEEPNYTAVNPDWIANNPSESVLSKKCPDQYNDIQEKDVVVWVDPLDGTSEYAAGLLENVTVLIGIAVGDRALGGVIHQPYFTSPEGGCIGRTIWGLQGVGIGGFIPKAPTKDKFILTTTRSHSNPLVEETLKKLNPDTILRVGGAGYKILLLLEGKAHAYVFASPGCKRWDTCAPEAILTAIGGKLTDVHGNLYSYSKSTPYQNKGGVLAAVIEEYHEKCRKAIPPNILK